MSENKPETTQEFIHVFLTPEEFEEFRQALQRGRNALIAQAEVSNKEADRIIANGYDETFAQPVRNGARQLSRDAKILNRWWNKTKNAKPELIIVSVDWAAPGKDQTAVIVVRDGIVTTETATTDSSLVFHPAHMSPDPVTPDITLDAACVGRCNMDMIATSESENAVLGRLLDHIMEHHSRFYAKVEAEGRLLARSINGRGYFDSDRRGEDGWHIAPELFRRAWCEKALKSMIRDRRK